MISFVHKCPLVVDHIDPISQLFQTHSSWLGRLARFAENLAFKRSAATLFVYESERDRVETMASDTIKTALGVDYDRFDNPSEAVLNAGRRMVPKDSERPIVVYIGGLESTYNIEAMIEACSDLDSGSLIIAGAGSLEPVVRQSSERNENIHFIGTVPHGNVPGLLAASDVGLSLVNDPHTLKILEYGAAGIPVVQLDGRARSRFGGCLTYTDGEPASVHAAITSAADCDSGPLNSFVRQFDWRDIAKTYDRVLTNAIRHYNVG
jgi:glycosyltransferase involved in cell wall biosynthesis